MLPEGCVMECRGCRHREWTMKDSLKQKHAFLSGKLSLWSDVIGPVESVPQELRWGYRTKTTLNARWDNSGWRFGMMSREELIDIPECPLHNPNVNSVLKLLREYLPSGNEFPLAFYVQTSAQIVLIVKARNIIKTSWIAQSFIDELRIFGVEGLWLHYNPSAGRRLFENTRWTLLFGSERSKDVNGLWYGPGAFQQLIPILFKKSLDEVSIFFDLTPNHSVVDLYCGTGTSMAQWTRAGAEVLGVELGKEAIECARLNIPEAVILRGACRHRIPQIKEWVNHQRSEGREICLYINPPRTGIEQEVLDWIIKESNSEKIAYLSCSAGTLSKNLDYLTRNGYKVIRIIPYDFFPQTIHVECLVLLIKTKKEA
jgi:23S rRNA (uracil1939-C5)-methyltransferase